MPTNNKPNVGKLATDVKVIPVVADADEIAADKVVLTLLVWVPSAVVLKKVYVFTPLINGTLWFAISQ